MQKVAIKAGPHQTAPTTIAEMAYPPQPACVDLAGCFLYIAGQPAIEARIAPEICGKSLRKL
jgi:hypothetical protein